MRAHLTKLSKPRGYYAVMAKSLRSKRKQKIKAKKREKCLEIDRKKCWEKHVALQAEKNEDEMVTEGKCQ